jgi:hypothetical protein
VTNGTTTERPAWRTRAGGAALALAFIAWLLVLIDFSESNCNSGTTVGDIFALVAFFAATPLAAIGVAFLMRWRLHPWRSSLILAGTIIAALAGEGVTLVLAIGNSGCLD